MPQASPTPSPADAAPSVLAPAGAAGTVDHISALLHSLEEVASRSGLASQAVDPATRGHEDRLVDARLGVASSLFTALRCKHAPTAAHCLRVAISCSQWACALQMPDALRTQLELAALLHDVGKIGVPDGVLLKQGRLHEEDVATLARHPQMASEILRHAGAPSGVTDVIVASGAWYDGSHEHVKLAGDAIPLLARMLAIVDAYDSMTTDHVYRPARSRERAVAELFACAGTQFDPALVRNFAEQASNAPGPMREEVARRWLGALDAAAPLPWAPTARLAGAAPWDDAAGALFERVLIEHMHDGVIFVDPQRRIHLWNTGAERLTGVASAAAVGQTLAPSLLVMSRPDGALIDDEACPIAAAIATGAAGMQRMSVIGRNGSHVEVDLHAIPVMGPGGAIQGATVLLHDASSEASLEERCHALHVEMTKDPLTQVANRAEFDRALAMFVDAHQESSLPCSLIMTDIDHFKSINDTYGHQAGDQVIVTFAAQLKSMCRSGDLVARYGGEEFAVLCADCTNAAAAARAEQMRKQIAEVDYAELGGRPITASFGVSELQSGDTPETLLRRADRALLQAKDQGRNQVVQLGAGRMDDSPRKSWWGLGGWRGNKLVEARLVTNVPIEVAVEKLRGFIADHNARILKTDAHEIRLESSDAGPDGLRRKGDRPLGFVIDLKLSEEHIERENAAGMAKGVYAQTTAEVTIRPRRDRDGRRGYAADRARRLLGSLKSYLMARESDLEPAAQS